MKRLPLFIGLVVLAAAAAACGGGGTSAVVGLPSTPTPASSSATVAFTIVVPTSAPATAKRPNFDAPSGAQSVSIVLSSVNGSNVTSTPVNANLSIGTNTVNVPGAAGSDTFYVKTFSQPNQGGSVLGAGNVDVTATAGETTTAPTTLSGTIASIAVSVPGSVPLGASVAVPVTIIAKDANGNTILGTYASAITLSDTDASSQTSLSATNIPDSTTGATITLNYKGGAMSAPATIGASASGVSVSNVTTASFTPDATYGAAGTTTFSVDEGASFGLYPSTPPPVSIGTTQDTLAVSTGASFNGVTGLLDAHEVAGIGDTYPTTSDTYSQWNIGTNGSQLVTVGDTLSYGSPGGTSNYTTTCVAPYVPTFALGTVPSGNVYAGTGPCTTSEGTYSDVINADGSYVYNEPGVYVGVANSNGTGELAETNLNGGYTLTATYTPAPGASTIPQYVATVAGAIPSPANLPTPGPANTSEPNWFVQAGFPNAQPPSPLQSQTITAPAATTLPAQCPVPTSLLGNSPQISEQDVQFSALDPNAGYYTSDTKNYFLNGVGLVCAIDTEVAWLPPQGSTLPSISTQVYAQYATQSTLQASLAQAGFAHALAAQSAALAASMQTRERYGLIRMRRAAMQRRAQ